MTQLTTPPAFVYNRWRTWGILLLTMWSLLLALTSFLYAVILYDAVVPTQPTAIALLIGLNIAFGVGFSGTTYGMGLRRPWGRISFMILILMWSGLNLWAIFTADPPYPLTDLLLNSARHFVGLIIPLIYLNLPHIKTHFGGNE